MENLQLAPNPWAQQPFIPPVQPVFGQDLPPHFVGHAHAHITAPTVWPNVRPAGQPPHGQEWNAHPSAGMGMRAPPLPWGTPIPAPHMGLSPGSDGEGDDYDSDVLEPNPFAPAHNPQAYHHPQYPPQMPYPAAEHNYPYAYTPHIGVPMSPWPQPQPRPFPMMPMEGIPPPQTPAPATWPLARPRSLKRSESGTSRRKSKRKKRRASMPGPPPLMSTAFGLDPPDYNYGVAAPMTPGQRMLMITPEHAFGGTYNKDTLAARPANWRAEYVPPSKRGAFWSRAANAVSNPFESTDKSIKIHPHLRAPSASSPSPAPGTISLDLRSHTPTTSSTYAFRPLTKIDRAQLATMPPVPTLNLHSPLLPWSTTITASTSAGVTIGDVLAQLSRSMLLPVDAADFWNRAMRAEDRERVARAFERRTGADIREVGCGVRRVDYLERESLFVGVKRGRGRDGGWEMILRRA